ncbi:hypothetical protein [Pseudomonas sp. DWP1b1]|uniref:hypothetical protein n=1 Tax=unclassified Pseudomonas TaxID=196821 RepID=UPI003CF4A595
MFSIDQSPLVGLVVGLQPLLQGVAFVELTTLSRRWSKDHLSERFSVEPCLIGQLPFIPPRLDLPTPSSTDDRQDSKNNSPHIQHKTALAQIHNRSRAGRECSFIAVASGDF